MIRMCFDLYSAPKLPMSGVVSSTILLPPHHQLPTFGENPSRQSNANAARQQHDSDDFVPHVESFIHFLFGQLLLMGMVMSVLVLTTVEDIAVGFPVHDDKRQQKGNELCFMSETSLPAGARSVWREVNEVRKLIHTF